VSQLRRKSIGVLPFSPVGRTFDDSVFADGIHNDILTQLSKISRLRVIDRESMVFYRDSKKTPRQIADDLDVGYLLEGSTRRSGGKIRITAQLIKTADKGQAWAETYDRNNADVFAVQSDIAQRIASSMEAVLSPAEKAAVEEIPTKSTEAYNYYIQGNYYWDNYFDSVGNAKAAELYEKAGEKDPSFAQAFARAAVVNYAVYSLWDPTPARRARISSAFEKARSLNPEDPVVQWAHGGVVTFLDSDRGWRENSNMALEEYRNALETRPNWAEIHRDIGRVLMDEGALLEARESFRRFFSLSPMALSVGWGGDPGSVSSWLKDYDAARKEVDEYIARHPDDPNGYQSKAAILIDGFGDLEGARTVLEAGRRLPLNQYRGSAYAITASDYWELNYFGGNFRDALSCLVGSAGRPGVGLWTRWWWWTPWLQKGLTYVALNQRASAMACFDSALVAAERLPSRTYKHICTGMVLALRGEHEKAALEIEKARKFDNPWWQRKLIEEADVLSAVLSGDTTRALNLLEKLIPEPGLNLAVWRLRLDPVYNPLRSNQRFQALVRSSATDEHR
jgi:TolB-like protein